MSPAVSVIIPAFNGASFIGEAIQSVMHQTFQDFELLIIDDGSTDNQKQIIDAFRLTDQRIKYIYQNNQGVSAARNYGFSKSQGTYIAFLDCDDVWLPDNLAVKMQKFKTDDFGLVHSDAMIINETSEDQHATLVGMEGRLLDSLLLWEGTQIPGPSSTLIRRDVLDAIGLFDEALSTAADKEFFFRVAAKYKIGRVSEVTWKYRVHKENMHKNLFTMEKDVLRMYEKARALKLFRTRRFEKKCFAAMYLILAASWAGNGKNLKRSTLFVCHALMMHPPSLLTILKKSMNRWR